jgi:cytochrome c biogenesis protein CcmG/thiol:disulfide interchange protein DsbE
MLDVDAGKYAVYVWPAFAVSAPVSRGDDRRQPGPRPALEAPGRGPDERPSVKRWLAFAPLIALALLAVLFAGYSLKRNPQIQPSAMVGRPVPDLTLPELETGRPVPLRQAITGPVLVNFYASWCAPCELEAPALMRLKAQGVAILGVGYKDAPENNRAFLGRLGDPFAPAGARPRRSGRAGVRRHRGARELSDRRLGGDHRQVHRRTDAGRRAEDHRGNAALTTIADLGVSLTISLRRP